MNSKKTILVAGATGYLGRHVLEAAVQRGYRVRAVVRDPSRLPEKISAEVEAIQAQLTDPQDIAGLCTGVDYVFSSLGITRQKGATYEEVDYGANHNLLEEARRGGVKKFIYVAALSPEHFRGNPMVEAKEQFCRELAQSGLPYTILRPTGFFSDISEFFTMAAQGRVYVPGNGTNRLNPISGSDLARVALDTITTEEEVLPCGGPEIFTTDEIARLAFDVLGTKPRITHVPLGLSRFFLSFLRPFNRRLYTIGDFILRGGSRDFVAPQYGENRLRHFFEELKSRR